VGNPRHWLSIVCPKDQPAERQDWNGWLSLQVQPEMRFFFQMLDGNSGSIYCWNLVLCVYTALAVEYNDEMRSYDITSFLCHRFHVNNNTPGQLLRATPIDHVCSTSVERRLHC
jgi:hypothetical protein